MPDTDIEEKLKENFQSGSHKVQKMKYTFIINTKARSGKGGIIWNMLKPELKKRRINCDIFYTEYAGHATKIAADATSDGGEHTLIVLGGDGSVGEVLSGIRDCSKVTLGFIPTGSGNDFSRELKLPVKPSEALKNILEPGRIVPMDVGIVKSGGIYRFAVSTGIGFDASVCHYAEKSRMKMFLNRIHLGSLVYLGTALKRLFADPLYEADVWLDDNEPLHFQKVYFAAAMNQPYEGGGFRFCPDAKPDDGLLDVIVVSGLLRLKVLCLLPTAFLGKHVRFQGIDIYKCKKVRIETNEKAAIHTDGQPIAVENVLEAEISRKQIRVIVS